MMVMTRKPTQTEESSQKVEESTQPAAQNKKKKTTGRPSKYTPEIAAEICERLSEGEPLREICRDPRMPAWRTIYLWMHKDEDLYARIARARDIGYDKMAEECLEIADNMQMGIKETVIVDAKGNESVSRANEDMLGHRRLQIETRLKLLAKFHPTKYGDKAVKEEDQAPKEAEKEAKKILNEVIKSIELKRKNAVD